MMKKARIIVEYNGKRYRPSGSWKCESKKDCSLFDIIKCTQDGWRGRLPCEAICDVFAKIAHACPNCGWKEVK